MKRRDDRCGRQSESGQTSSSAISMRGRLRVYSVLLPIGMALACLASCKATRTDAESAAALSESAAALSESGEHEVASAKAEPPMDAVAAGDTERAGADSLGSASTLEDVRDVVSSVAASAVRIGEAPESDATTGREPSGDPGAELRDDEEPIDREAREEDEVAAQLLAELKLSEIVSGDSDAGEPGRRERADNSGRGDSVQLSGGAGLREAPGSEIDEAALRELLDKVREEELAAADTGSGTAPLTRGDTAPEPAQETPAAEPEAAAPKGYVTFKTLWHKTSAEALRFLQEARPDWIENGHVAKVEGKMRSLIIFGETDTPEDPLTARIAELLDRFDRLDLKIEREVIKPRYVQTEIVLDALSMSGLVNVWASANTQDVIAWKEGDANRSLTRTKRSYVDQGIIKGRTAPIDVPPQVPFVFNMPKEDPFVLPTVNAASTENRVLMSFDKTSSTEERGGMLVVGTAEDIERVRAFVDQIDVPARRIMIEVQLIELDANKLQDVGFDSLQFGERHSIANLALPLPGEAITQPGLGPDARRDSEQLVPDIVNEGLSFFFDDTSFDLQGRFLTSVHALVREGEAKIKARPKILTLDDRTSILHLGRDVPTFVSTRVTQDTNNSNLVSEVSEVGTVYAGITLNIRPRVTGGDEDEVSLQIEVVDNQIVGRQRVFEEDLAGIPEVIRRQYIGQARAKNHRPVILGGLIQEQDVESVNKIPLLADIPFLGYLFRRTTTSHQRTEVIIVVTPHILSEKGIDPIGAPKESVHFDTFDSVLFNDRHILKGGDILGLDPISKTPAQTPDGDSFTESDVLDLTLLNVVRKRELVSKLRMFETYLGDELEQLSWFQRRWPETSVKGWDDEDQELYFKVAAICIENLKELNPDLDFADLTLPRREIVLPTSPYRVTLSYDRVKRVQSMGLDYVFRGEVELNAEQVALIRDNKEHRLAAFGEFLATQKLEEDEAVIGRRREDHGDLFLELRLFYEESGRDPKEIEGIPYPEVWRKLEGAGLDFGSLAAFLRTNLRERYALAPLDVGLFIRDFEAFAKSTVSLRERAKKLKTLEQRWARSATDSGSDS